MSIPYFKAKPDRGASLPYVSVGSFIFNKLSTSNRSLAGIQRSNGVLMSQPADSKVALVGGPTAEIPQNSCCSSTHDAENSSAGKKSDVPVSCFDPPKEQEFECNSHDSPVPANLQGIENSKNTPVSLLREFMLGDIPLQSGRVVMEHVDTQKEERSFYSRM
ncbi:hypothetical protein JTB14_010423 [Gonioctena quinquepunctata]|nr:hypothetical protein JTB14_010423 [Gonioctena quinquepunctata]